MDSVCKDEKVNYKGEQRIHEELAEPRGYKTIGGAQGNWSVIIVLANIWVASGDREKANDVTKRSSEGEGLHVKLWQNEKKGDSEGE